MKILDGKTLGLKLREELKNKVSLLKKESQITPGLAVILVGDNPASQVYVKQKLRACTEAGFYSLEYKFPSNTSSLELKKQIEKLNEDPKIHGILVQLPLPSSLNERTILSYINPEKDPDGLTLENKGKLWSFKPRVVPCTPKGILALLKHYDIPLEGQEVVIVGRSQIVGLPLVQQFLENNASVIICHSFTKDVSRFTKNADIVVVCAGKEGLLGKKDFKKDAVVVDVGIHRNEESGGLKLKGDVDAKDLDTWLLALSPVPGGVGPMTIAMLLENTFELAKNSLSRGDLSRDDLSQSNLSKNNL